MDREWLQQVGMERLKRASNANAPALTVLRARRYLAKFPTRGYAWHLLGVALIELTRYEEAEQALDRAIELCPAEKLWLPYHCMGDLFKFAGDYDRAASWYGKSIDAFPDDCTGYIYLGGIFTTQGRHQEAEQVFRMGTHCTDGCLDEAYLNLGFALRAQEKFEDAAECFREAIRRDPHYKAAKRALRDVIACLRLRERGRV